jgi:hypothetical protein
VPLLAAAAAAPGWAPRPAMGRFLSRSVSPPGRPAPGFEVSAPRELVEQPIEARLRAASRVGHGGRLAASRRVRGRRFPGSHSGPAGGTEGAAPSVRCRSVNASVSCPARVSLSASDMPVVRWSFMGAPSGCDVGVDQSVASCDSCLLGWRRGSSSGGGAGVKAIVASASSGVTSSATVASPRTRTARPSAPRRGVLRGHGAEVLCVRASTSGAPPCRSPRPAAS